jgi:hypothetical protein
MLGWVGAGLLSVSTQAAVITVTTSNNVNPGAAEISLVKALETVSDGDEIRFNIPGPGPHYLITPSGGYPEITAHGITINGYSQPGSSANSNGILASNNAKIGIFLDARESGGTVLNYDGYSSSESAVLAVVGATNVAVRGLGFLGRIVQSVSEQDPAVYFVAFANKASGGHVSGCWMGVDADGAGLFGANAGVTGFRFRDAGVPFLTDNITVGVAAGATNAPAQFNVIAGMEIPVIVEGANLRVSGNFLNVLPNGTNDVNHSLLGLPNQGAIQVGRDGSGTLIGTDGDGANDENERNIFGGVIPETVDPVHGYRHVIEFYGGGARENVVVAGNYFGVGIDGTTRFTNGVPVISGLTGVSRVGSDFDGVSDAVEGNWIFNNYPSSLFTPDVMVRDFLENAGQGAVISLRGNRLVNNFAPPVSPLRDAGFFIGGYYSKALLDVGAGVVPGLAADSDIGRLKGTVPAVDDIAYPVTWVDVYAPDAEGLGNSVPELENAFVQGSVYLGTFQEGGAADLNPEPGLFEFDVRSLGLLEGDRVTITANYSQDPVGTRNARTLTTPFSLPASLGAAVVLPPTKPGSVTIARVGNQIRITWEGTGFNLQSAPAISGPWSNEASTGGSFTIDIGSAEQFFRLSSP